MEFYYATHRPVLSCCILLQCVETNAPERSLHFVYQCLFGWLSVWIQFGVHFRCKWTFTQRSQNCPVLFMRVVTKKFHLEPFTRRKFSTCSFVSVQKRLHIPFNRGPFRRKIKRQKQRALEAIESEIGTQLTRNVSRLTWRKASVCVCAWWCSARDRVASLYSGWACRQQHTVPPQ